MKTVEQVLREVFENPTAPYRENWVLAYVEKELKKLKVPFFKDRWGNIVAGVSKPAELRRSRRLALVAHTDHPGFHLLKKKKENLWLAQWFGGVCKKTQGARVAIYDPRLPGQTFYGVIQSKNFDKQGRFLIKLNKSMPPLDDSCFGAFAFKGFEKRRGRIFTRAADDLTGVTIILSTLARLNGSQRRGALGIFTRAEETGFRGALGILYQNILGPQNTAISLEASRQLEGARIGQGPVIRLGDKKTLFDSTVTSLLDQASQEIQKNERSFKVQRRIMNGGTCEATPFNLHHIRTSGIAVPLGNYHNQRADHRPGAEYIALTDVEAAVKLCVQMYKNLQKRKDPTGDFLKILSKGFQKDKKLLQRQVKFLERHP